MADMSETSTVFPSNLVRGSDYFLVVRGEWLESFGAVLEGQPIKVGASAAQIASVPWIAERADRDGTFSVELADVERYVYVQTECSYRGGGPFKLTGIVTADRNRVVGWVSAMTPGYQARIVYEGTELREWAESLQGLESSGVHDAFGYCVFGIVPLSETSDYREVHTERPIPGRDGVGS